MAVMQSGSIAAVAFVYGDYASFLIPAGAFGSAVHAVLAVVALTVLQLMGTRQGTLAQIALTTVTVAALLTIAVIGFSSVPLRAPEPHVPTGEAGLAMVFVLLAYGGWSEAAYLSGEIRDPKRDIPRVLIFGTATVMALYLLANLSYLRALGLEGLSRSNAVAADLVAMALGEKSAAFVAAIVCLMSLSTLNATIFTGARSIYALGKSFAPFAVLGRSGTGDRAPRVAILAQTAIVIALLLLGAFSRDGFEAMVEYTAPVFWIFMLLVGAALFVFRRRDPLRDIPFRVPLYPLTPLLFCASSAYLLYSSLAYTGRGALLGAGIFLAGIPIFRLGRRAAVTKRRRSGGRRP
jgi:amino acid transporter